MMGRDLSSSESEDLDHDKEAFGKEYIRRYGLYDTSRANNDTDAYALRSPPSALRRRVSVNLSQHRPSQDEGNVDHSSVSDISRPAVHTAPTPQPQSLLEKPKTSQQVGRKSTHTKINSSRRWRGMCTLSPKAVLAVVLTLILASILWHQPQLHSVQSFRPSWTGRRHVHPPAELGQALKSPHLREIHSGIWAVIERLRESKVEDIDVAVGSLTELANSIRANQNIDAVVCASLGTETISQLRQVTAIDVREGYRPLLNSLTMARLHNERARKSINEVYLALRSWRRTSTRNAFAAQETLKERNIQARANVFFHIGPGEGLQDRAEHVKIEARLRLWTETVDWITRLTDEAHKELSWRQTITEHLETVVQLVTQRIKDPESESLDVITVRDGVDLQVRDLIRIKYREIFEASPDPEVMNLAVAYLPVG